MSSLLEMLGQQLGGDAVHTISNTLGTDKGATSKAVSSALPMLLGALSNNSAKPDGAQALLGAIDRDHDGGVLDGVMDFLGTGDTSPGAGILRHVLGSRQSSVEAGIGQASGLDSASVGKVLAMLAPLVMGALGRAKREKGLDASGLASLLGGERQRAEREAPDAMGLVGQLLDSDGDGQVLDDVAKIGGSLLGGLFGKKR